MLKKELNEKSTGIKEMFHQRNKELKNYKEK